MLQRVNYSENTVSDEGTGLRPLSSLKDGAIHGLYAGITDAIFPALLSFLHAPVLVFNTMTHGSNVVSVISQLRSARETFFHEQPKKILAKICAFQAALSFILFCLLFLFPQPGRYFSYIVCLISMLTLYVGNYASPLWHAIWAALMPVEQRIIFLANRLKVMNLFSLLALILSFILFKVADIRFAILSMLFTASVAKTFSVFYLLKDKTFPEENFLKEYVVSGSLRLLSNVQFLILSPFYFSLGIATGFLIPFLCFNLKFDAQQIFYLSSLQFCGNIVSSVYLRSFSHEGAVKSLFFKSLIILSLSPLLWCIAGNFIEWAIIFFVNGVAGGFLALGVMQLVHLRGCPNQVAWSQASISICTTLSMVLGGVTGALLMQYSWLDNQNKYYLIFLTSCILRLFSIYPVQRKEYNVPDPSITAPA